MPYNCKTTNLTLYFRHRFTFKRLLKKYCSKNFLKCNYFVRDSNIHSKANNLQGRQGPKNGYPDGQKTGKLKSEIFEKLVGAPCNPM